MLATQANPLLLIQVTHDSIHILQVYSKIYCLMFLFLPEKILYVYACMLYS